MTDGPPKFYIRYQDIRKDQGRDYSVIGDMRLSCLWEQNGEEPQKNSQTGNIQERSSSCNGLTKAHDYKKNDAYKAKCQT